MKRKKTKYQLMMESCPILYQEKDKPCTETCMCWGIEAGEGWLKPLTKLSNALEELNRQYWDTYGVKIVASQVKEKYGTLHFYYDIVPVESKVRHLLHAMLEKACMWISCHVDFKTEPVEIKPETQHVEVKEITLDEYKTAINGIPCSNVTYKIIDGKIQKEVEYTSYAVTNYLPTKHKLIYKLRDKLQAWKNSLSFYGASRKQSEIVEILERKADDLVHAAEDECYHSCECCGKSIGTKSSPRCATLGWIRYLCEDCAAADHRMYSKCHEVWKDKVLVKTKAQLEKEDAEREKQWKKNNAERASKAKKRLEKAEKMLREGKDGII